MLDDKDATIIRAAATILDRIAVNLLERHDPLAEAEGYVGYAAADAAREVWWFLDKASRAGLLPALKHAAGPRPAA